MQIELAQGWEPTVVISGLSNLQTSWRCMFTCFNKVTKQKLDAFSPSSSKSKVKGLLSFYLIGV